MKKRLALAPILAAVCALVMIIGSGTNICADERDEKTGQVIHNTINMSRLAGKPTIEDIALWKRSGTTDHGVGYRCKPVQVGSGDDLIAFMISISYINQQSADITLAMFAGAPMVKDATTGADIFIARNERNPDAPPHITYLLYKDGVQLTMMYNLRKNVDDQEAISMTQDRYHYLVAEAKRLKLISGE
jgi:hypothetical protein